MSDINELLSRDPSECTDADMDEIVRLFRERRRQFDLGNMLAGKTKPMTAKAAEAVKATGKLDLKKFGL